MNDDIVFIALKDYPCENCGSVLPGHLKCNCTTLENLLRELLQVDPHIEEEVWSEDLSRYIHVWRCLYCNKGGDAISHSDTCPYKKAQDLLGTTS